METAEVVVIGGGCMGASVAYHLTRRGVRNVLLIERAGLAAGATGKSTALIRQHYSLPALCRMARAGLRIFERFDQTVGGDVGFMRTGMVFAVGPEQEEALRSNVAMQQGLGIRVELLDSAELRRLSPWASTDDIACAAYEPEAGFADPVATTWAFAQRARVGGARLALGRRATGLRVEGGRLAVVETDQGPVATRCAVLAAGGWSDRLLRPLGVDLPIANSRWPVTRWRRPEARAGSHVVFADLVRGVYVRPAGSDTSLVGNVREEGGEPCDPEEYDEGVSGATVAAHRAHLLGRFPLLAGIISHGGYSGFYDVTPDWQPVLDHVPGAEGLVVAAGFSGHGFKLSPVVGAWLAELATEGAVADEDAALFRLARFSEGALLRPQAAYGSRQL